MINYTTQNGTVIGLMTPEGNALSIRPADGKQIIPDDLAEFANWLKRDPLRCYVAVDAFTGVAMAQLFPQPSPSTVATATQDQLASAIDQSAEGLKEIGKPDVQLAE